MRTQLSHSHHNFPVFEPSLSDCQFESLKSQLKQLTPAQLRSLQNEIDANLSPESSPLLTHEELDVLSSLF
ncbi:hypothetical protein [Vibrio gazogenes]|uniref:Uncharacterized protein n=1 Tax=Vibrio gazogenes DSM 21264 = NBRC 103151 TaxID=1123492 RepID=A0A1M4VN20_VIBGA|nr:hypothetical protein [Vibrio gazogenes]USP15504.1 hypothetical protein MKS89_19085 [Vibrio gazogenes]SHE70308.1 hypothetical protein SAMN02745781_00759 [Vibrio gazogenes DSM 21264] [Vibrio gazogenes DSM 21264 = NBRC 103151]SJN57421.1 hypothetical protein BQ6471_02532 [Vibrio gazogenes]